MLLPGIHHETKVMQVYVGIYVYQIERSVIIHGTGSIQRMVSDSDLIANHHFTNHDMLDWYMP